MFSLARASVTDAPALCEAMTKSFDDDARRFFGLASGGPPRYNELQYQVELAESRAYNEPHDYFKLLWNEQIIGGLVVFPGDGISCHLGCIYLVPEHQNAGLGSRCLAFLDREYPHARSWTLETPSVCTRNHHFYEKHGFVKIGESEPDDGDVTWKYQRIKN